MLSFQTPAASNSQRGSHGKKLTPSHAFNSAVLVQDTLVSDYRNIDDLKKCHIPPHEVCVPKGGAIEMFWDHAIATEYVTPPSLTLCFSEILVANTYASHSPCQSLSQGSQPSAGFIVRRRRQEVVREEVQIYDRSHRHGHESCARKVLPEGSVIGRALLLGWTVVPSSAWFQVHGSDEQRNAGHAAIGVAAKPRELCQVDRAVSEEQPSEPDSEQATAVLHTGFRGVLRNLFRNGA